MQRQRPHLRVPAPEQRERPERRERTERSRPADPTIVDHSVDFTVTDSFTITIN